MATLFPRVSCHKPAWDPFSAGACGWLFDRLRPGAHWGWGPRSLAALGLDSAGVSGVHNPGWAGSCYVIPAFATAAHVPRPPPCLSPRLPAAGTLSGHPSKVPPPSGLHSSPANPQLPLLHWELMATVLNKVFLTLLVSVRIIFSLTCFLIRYPVSHKTN